MTASRKILVVDDDPVVGKSFDRVLSGKGYAVITAADGQEALSKLAAEEYDVVYTDIRMPGMSGLEVAESIKANQPWTPVVIITGYGSAENEARAKAAGVKGFLNKPLSPDMIVTSAREALEEIGLVKETPVAAPRPIAPLPAPGGIGTAVKNIALFFAAPFVALAYIIAFPFVGLGMLAWIGIKATARTKTGSMATGIAKNVGLSVSAPLIALAYIILFPFIGIALLVRTAFLAYRSRGGED
jgi:CheY-like chemotaxis protein